ncbi:MAG: helix-turn-helix transcriptional regulator [Treponema sp.]|nr:helix-turn-helix transcriptional regulator [Treponema sp.]
MMNERIKQVRLSAKLSQTEFAEKILVSRSAVCKMESGENSPSEQTVKLICQEFNVNGDWLRTGNGEMFVELSKDEQISAMLGEIQRLGDENFKYRLVSALCKLSESDWTALENLVDMISDKK